MAGRSRASGVVLSLLLVALGVVLLLNNLGLLRWSVWRWIAHLWPLVLILGGAWLLWRHLRGD